MARPSSWTRRTSWLVPAVQVTDATIISNLTAGTKNDYPNIPLRFEQIDFSCAGKVADRQLQHGIDDDSAAFDKANLLPQFGAPLIGHTMLNAYLQQPGQCRHLE